MKTKYLSVLILALCVIFAACGSEKEESKKDKSGKETTTVSSETTEVSTTEVTTSEDDHLLIAKSEEPFNFCTKYSDEYTYKWDDECGITIYPKSEGSIPYVLVWRSYDTHSTAEDIHLGDKSEMNYYYGNDFISSTDPRTYTIGGKELSGAEYVYKVGEFEVNMIRLVDSSPASGYVLYTAKYLEGDKEETLEALETAITYYRAGKDSYELSGGQKPEYEIVPSITQTIRYENVQDGWFSMDIPSGWTVDSASFDGTTAAFIVHVYDPYDPDKQIFVAMQNLAFVSQKAYTKLCNYPLAGSAFEGIPYLSGGSNPVYELFQNFEVYRNSQYGRYLSLAPINDWTAIESFGQTPLGGELIRASYKNNDGKEIQGIFSAKWANGITMYGYQYPGVFYSPMYFTAPADEFNEWADILNHCISSFQYSENYISDYYAAEKATMTAFKANTQIYNETSDLITSSWNARQTSYDTISEKQSDATLGYDRVYNTETNEVYRVSVGFMDSYSGTLYQAIDDSMYSVPIAGYIY